MSTYASRCGEYSTADRRPRAADPNCIDSGSLRPDARPFLTFRTEDIDDGRLLSSVLRTRHGFSRSMIRRLKRDDCAFINGRAARMRDRVAAGDDIALVLPPDHRSVVLPEDTPMTVVYEDGDVLVIDKPGDMLVHPSGHTLSGTAANAVAGYLIRRGETSSAGPVTRLDRHTSGLVLFAKHPHAHHVLSQFLSEDLVQRHYVAIVQGQPESKHGVIRAPIRRVADHAIKREVGAGGQEAITHYTVLRHLGPRHAMIQARLETGRTHQIRVHLAHLGHPIVGDDVYGSGQRDLIPRQALHAITLYFPHPRTRRHIHVTSPLADDIAQLATRLVR